MTEQVKVIVVDDSAFIRKKVTEMLESDARLTVVGRGRNGAEGLELIERHNPDVVVTDLSMPEVNGIEFIRTQMQRKPLPMVVLSIASETGDLAEEALGVGAFEYVSKPTGLFNEQVTAIRDELVEKVLVASSIPPHKLNQQPRVAAAGPNGRRPAIDLVVMGLSTGGPRALETIVDALPSDFPVPLAAVVHMPIGYTSFFARRLNESSHLEVLEARDGLDLMPSRLVLGQAGLQMVVARLQDGRLIARTPSTPHDTLHKPSVDTLFRSAAEVLGERVLGVVLTGMGRDGTEGSAWIAGQGGTILAQDEETSVVYGMPRAVVEAGIADHVLPLAEIPAAIIEHATRKGDERDV